MSNIKKALYIIVPIVFWITVWELLYLFIDLDFVFPSFFETVICFFKNLVTLSFWKTILYSFLRITVGFAIGVVLGCFLSAVAYKSRLIRNTVSPAISVIKATPVASFILVLWVLIGSSSVPVAIAVLMVLPVIWQNLTDGYNAVDKSLTEVCDVFEVTGFRRFKILTAPTLFRFFVPAVFTASGLAWKAGIAAEIIAYTKNSIGKEISDAKNFFDGAELFSWTITVIILSLLIEKLISLIVRRFKLVESVD